MSAAAVAVVLAIAVESVVEKTVVGAGAEEEKDTTAPLEETVEVNTVILSKSINGPVPDCEPGDIVMVCSVPSKSPR